MHGALQELQPSFSGRCGVQHTDFSRADLLSVYRALRRVKRSRHERVTHVYQLTLKGWVLPDACEELTAAAKSMCALALCSGTVFGKSWGHHLSPPGWHNNDGLGHICIMVLPYVVIISLSL